MQQSVGGAIGRIIGVFAVIGVGLGFGGLLFLWATDYFNKTADGGLGSALVGGLTIAALLIFALLIGVVIAALGGLHAANHVGSRGGAVASGLVAGSLGHVAMIAVLAAIMTLGIQALSGDTSNSSDATPAQSEAPSPDPDCARSFGEDSPICQGLNRTPKALAPETQSNKDKVSWATFFKLGLGFIPASLVGGTTAAILFSKREDE